MRRLFVPVLIAISSVGDARTLQILPLGDSITVGIVLPPTGGQKYDPPGSYRYLLEQKLMAERVDFGFTGVFTTNPAPGQKFIFHTGSGGFCIGPVPGDTNDLYHKISWMLPWFGGDQPDIILYLIGINDTFRGVNAATLTTNFNNSISDIFARRPNVSIYVSTLIGTTRNTTWQTFNDNLRSPLGPIQTRAMQGQKIALVDMGPRQIFPSKMYDYVHPTAAGQAEIAEGFFQAILPEVRQHLLPPPVSRPKSAQKLKVEADAMTEGP